MRSSGLLNLILLTTATAACGPAAGATTDGADTDAPPASNTGTSPTTGLTETTTGAGEGPVTDSAATSTSGADDSATGDSSTAAFSTGDYTTTDPTTATGVDTEEPPAGFGCEGALWFTVVTQGQMNAVGLDSRGHTIGFGSHGTKDPDSENALIVDLDPAGAVVRAYEPKTPVQDYIVAGGVDGDDNVYAIVSGRELRKFAVGGEKVAQVDLEDPGQVDFYALSVAPTGDLTLGLEGALTRMGPDLAIEWQLASDVSVHASNSAGMIIARRWPDEMVLLDTSGGVVWERTWDQFGTPTFAINEAGQIVAADRDNGDQLVIARFDPDGAPVWETHFSILNQFDNILAVAINGAGEIAATGTIQSGGRLHGFVVRLDPDGEIVAQHGCPMDQEIEPSSLALDDAGAIRIAGKVYSDFTYHSFIAAY